MFQSLPLFIGTRYLRAKRRNHFVSFISFASMFGIALGVMALITVLSVMNGFEAEIKSRILSMTPHITVHNWGSAPLTHWEALEKRLVQYPGVIGAAPVLEGQGMAAFNGNVQGVLIKGIQPETISNVYPLAAKITEGNLAELKPHRYGIIVGEGMAKHLGLKLGDKVTVFVPEATISPAGILPRFKRFEVIGLFKVGYLFDSSYAFVNMVDAASLLKFPEGSASGVQLELDNYLAAPRIAQSLYYQLNEMYPISSWTQQNASYFQAVKMEKTMMFLILTLIIVVAVFNLVTTLVMVVTDKHSDIAILRTFGATPKTILSIFVVQGSVAGIAGTLLGVLGGVILSLNVTEWVDAVQRFFEVQFLTADFYFVSSLPSHLEWLDVLKVSSVALILSVLATLYPAWQASRVAPAEALRYE
jgi:lipoprotein-releasing system permease protein